MQLDEATRRAAKMGEFQELAWLLRFELCPGLAGPQRGILLADLIKFTEANKLGIAGDLGSFTVVSLVNRSAVSTKEQSILLDWLLNRPEVRRIQAADSEDGLSDAWFEILLVDENATRSPAFDAFFS